MLLSAIFLKNCILIFVLHLISKYLDMLSCRGKS